MSWNNDGVRHPGTGQKHPVPRSQIIYHFSGRNTWGVATCSWTYCHTHSAASNRMHTGVPSRACWNYTITGWLLGAYTFDTLGGPPSLVTERVAHDTVAHIRRLWSLWFNFSPGGNLSLTLLAALRQTWSQSYSTRGDSGSSTNTARLKRIKKWVRRFGLQPHSRWIGAEAHLRRCFVSIIKEFSYASYLRISW